MTTARFGYANLSLEQVELLHATVKGRDVVDLGAGDCQLARMMGAQAHHVWAVDKEIFWGVKPDLPANVEFKEGRFAAVRPEQIPCHVMVVSWLVNNHNYVEDLVLLMAMLVENGADTFVWIGQNDRGSACGSPAMTRFMKRFEWAAVTEILGADGAHDMGVYRVKCISHTSPRALDPRIRIQMEPVP